MYHMIGLVADVRRDVENDFQASKCILFGINASEFGIIAAQAEIRPRHFDPNVERYVVARNPWTIMRILGSLGYHHPVTPISGRVDGPTGERRTCIWTLQKTLQGPTIVNRDS